MLAALEMPANFVPTTNAVLAEMQRRGISRDTILSELRRMGAEIPGPSVQMLQVPSLIKPVNPKCATGSRAGLLMTGEQMHSTQIAACMTRQQTDSRFCCTTMLCKKLPQHPHRATVGARS